MYSVTRRQIRRYYINSCSLLNLWSKHFGYLSFFCFIFCWCIPIKRWWKNNGPISDYSVTININITNGWTPSHPENTIRGEYDFWSEYLWIKRKRDKHLNGSTSSYLQLRVKLIPHLRNRNLCNFVHLLIFDYVISYWISYFRILWRLKPW